VRTAEGQQEAFIALQTQPTRVTGNAGCNRLTGSYQQQDRTLKFTGIATTRMACPQLDSEAALLAALDATARWQIEGDVLELFDATGTSLAKFIARNL
jgi:heat shock protein HslJ